MTATLEELSQLLFHLEPGGGDNHSSLDPTNQDILNTEFISDLCLIPVWKNLDRYSKNPRFFCSMPSLNYALYVLGLSKLITCWQEYSKNSASQKTVKHIP